MRQATTIIITAIVCLWSAAGLRADEAPAARAYLDRVFNIIDRVEADLPTIARAADAAAARYIAGADLGVRGGAGLAWELADRPGGLASYHGEAGEAKSKDVILYAFGDLRPDLDDEARAQAVAAQLAAANALREAGCVVIGIASHQRLEADKQLELARKCCTILIDNHADAPLAAGRKNRQDTRSDKHAAYTQRATVANAVVAWAFQCELFAACTRKQRTPIMLKSLDIDYRRKRYDRYRGLRFHFAHPVGPFAAGKLGESYLKELREVLRDVGSMSWRPLAGAAHRAASVIQDDGRVFIRAATTYLSHHHGKQVASIPNLLGLDHDGSNRSLPSPSAGDFVIAFGYIDPPGALWWGEPELLRDAGRGTCWVTSAYLATRRDLRRNEILVDQQWPEGDALIKPAGYDVRIGSASGIVAETIYWAMMAQIKADLGK